MTTGDTSSPVDLLAAVFGSEPAPRDPMPDPVAREVCDAVLRCRFFGRSTIHGLDVDHVLRVSGRMTLHLGQACVCNPDYERCDPAAAGDVVSS
jgi:hypothetical protein